MNDNKTETANVNLNDNISTQSDMLTENIYTNK